MEAKEPIAMYDTVVKYAKDNNVTPYEYGSYYLKNATFFYSIGSAGRAWTYQWCSELGWLQPYSPQNRIRSQSVTLKVFNDICTNSFGDIFKTEQMVRNTNIYLGGDNIKATNLILTNGYEDPWKWAGITSPKPNLDVMVIDCNDCGHCIDLHTPLDSDDPSLKKVRSKELYLMTKWVAEHYRNLGIKYSLQDL